jgi:hypothetical protein
MYALTMWDFVVKLLESVWDCLIFWRFAALILAIGILAAWGFRKHIINLLLSQQKRSHDTEIFRNSDAIMSEVTLSDMIELIGSNVRYRLSQAEISKSYLRFFDEAGNQYIDKGLRNKHKKFLDGLEQLKRFSTQHFFVEQIPAKDRWLGLYPDLRYRGDPEGNERFREYMNQLYAVTDKIIPSYRAYRKLVKSKLLV